MLLTCRITVNVCMALNNLIFVGWHPKGLLVAHLHEHKSAVNRIRVSDEHSIFATCSNDGTVKIWDSQKMEGKTTTTRCITLI